MLNLADIRKNFPFLTNNPDLIYFDSALTTLKPQIMIDQLSDFYSNYISSFERSRNKLMAKASELYFDSASTIASFINADVEELIFGTGATEMSNLLCQKLFQTLEDGDEIILGELEHASNVLPWIQAIENTKKQIKINWYQITDDFCFDYDYFKTLLTPRTKIVAIASTYNTIGLTNDIKRIKKMLNNQILIVDASQTISHHKIDVKDWDADFVFFSAHKILGPSGLGVLYGKKTLLKEMNPFFSGGGMNFIYTKNSIHYKDIPYKFIAGTPNIANIVAFAASISFLNNFNWNEIEAHLFDLKKYCEWKLGKLPNITILNLDVKSNILLFKVNEVSGEDVAYYLGQHNIFLRNGSQCVKLDNKFFKTSEALRISFFIYNTRDEIDKFIKLITETKTYELI